MIQVRKSEQRGHANHGWLDSHHTFSFAGYFDQAHMGFGDLRVINEDRIQGGKGFGAHGHKDMEIISYVIEGALEHEDSMGNKVVIRPGEVQRMSAGTGVQHSEQNHLKDKTTHFLQIWVVPERTGIAPGYAQKSFDAEFATGELILVASKAARNGSVGLNQDADVYASKSHRAGEKTFTPAPGRRLWIQVIRGDVQVDATDLHAGDGARVENVKSVQLRWGADSEFILFDLR